jgi:HlyD family secretion protein
VFKLFRESEGAVQTGEPLLEIGDVRNIEVKVELLSPDAVRIAPGTKVLFKRWGGEGTLEGRVRRVEPAGFTKVSSLGVEEQRVLTLVEITSPPERWRMLGDGYRLEVHFVLWEGRDVLQAPTSSLFRLGPQWSVFLEEQGRARRRTVEIGQRTGLAAQVLSGLKEGDRVVAYPDDAIAEGVRVRQRE